MIFPLFHILAAIFILFASMEFPGICKVTPKAIGKFLISMFYITLFRIIMVKLSGMPHGDPDPNSPMNTINLFSVFGVFWEDTFFTLPALIAHRLGFSKFFKGTLLAMSAVTFASGHLAYGLFWAAITLYYVPFLSYKYGKKYGLGTVMICHILYDFITLLTVRYLM